MRGPFRILRLPCKLYPAWSSKLAAVPWLTGCVCRANSSAEHLGALDRPSQRRLGIAPRCRFHQAVQRRQQLRVVQDRGGRRPPPGRRIRSGGNAPFRVAGPSTPRFQRNGGWRMCVASATAVTPPQPISRASLAAHNRRDRSLSALSCSKLPPDPGDGLCVLHPQVIAQSPSWHNTKFTKLFFYKP